MMNGASPAAAAATTATAATAQPYSDDIDEQPSSAQVIFEGEAPSLIAARSSIPSSSVESDDEFDDENDGRIMLQGSHNNNNNNVIIIIKKRSNIPSLVCAFMASLTTGGTTYAFGMYGDALKKTLGLSQTQLDTISTTFFFAGLLSWIPGLLADRFGTRLAMSLGGLLGAASLLTYWAVARQFVVLPNQEALVFCLSLLGIGIFLSSACVTGSVFKIITLTCGQGTKGSAVGVAKGYVGLGSGVYACIYEGLRRPSESDLDFLPMAAVFCICCATLPALVLLPTKQAFDTCTQGGGGFHEHAKPLHFRVLYVSLIAMAFLVVGNSLYALEETTSSSAATLVQQQESLADIVQNSENNDNGDTDNSQLFVASQEGGDSSSSSPQQQQQPQERHVGMSFMLVLIWLAPILSLLILPKRQSERIIYDIDPDNEIDNDDDNIMDDEDLNDNNNQNGSSSTHSGFRDEPDEPEQSEHGIGLTEVGVTLGPGDQKGTLTMRRLQHQPQEEEEEEEVLGLLTRNGHDATNSSIPHEHASDDGLVRDETTIRRQDRNQNDNHNDNTRHDHNRNDNDDATRNYNLAQMLQTPSALLMLWTTTILVGAGTVETNNMGQMVEALGLDKAVTPASLALFSVAQAFSRVVTGALSEAALNWNVGRRTCWIDNGVPRPFFLVVASLLGCVAHFILGLATDQTVFVIGAIIAGAAFGMVWPLMVLVVGEVFGPKHMGANYMFFDGFTSAAGTLFLSKIIAQDVYESHVNPEADDPNACYGTACFSKTHMIVAGLSLSCVVTSLAMMWVSRHVYNRSGIHLGV